MNTAAIRPRRRPSSLSSADKFAEWTSKGELRQPVYLGLRSDKGERGRARTRTVVEIASPNLPAAVRKKSTRSHLKLLGGDGTAAATRSERNHDTASHAGHFVGDLHVAAELLGEKRFQQAGAEALSGRRRHRGPTAFFPGQAQLSFPISPRHIDLPPGAGQRAIFRGVRGELMQRERERKGV